MNVGTVNAQKETDKTLSSYDVLTRLNTGLRPAGFLPTEAKAVNGAFNENVATVSNKVLNKDSEMLKIGRVQTIGKEGLSAWQMMCDEGGHTYEQSAPNPLSYMLSGISSSLLTQVEHAIKVMDLNVSDAKVEAMVYFRYTDLMNDKWTGYTDKLVANIIIESDEPAEKIAEVKKLAVQSWAVGECIANPTPVYTKYIYNSEIWDVEPATPGKTKGPDSYDNDLKLTSKENKLEPLTLELAPDVSMDKLPDPFEFQVVGLAESAHDAQRPFMHKIQIKALQENYATWHVYADDSHGYEGIDKAPTSRDYFTMGTTFCLMTQLACTDMIYKHNGLDIKDYRAEHQFNYQVDNYMTPTATGHVDGVTTRILMNSNVSEKVMSDFATMALRMCFAGEAVLNTTPMEIGVFKNGEIIEP